MTLITISIGLAAGCAESESTLRQPSLEGITLADLRAPDLERPDPVIWFIVTPFRGSPHHVQSAVDCFESLSDTGVRFLNEEAFERNGFQVVRGGGRQIGMLLECLRQKQLESSGQVTLVLDAGTELSFGQIYLDRHTLGYVTAEGDLREVSLHNGELGWSLSAVPDSGHPLVAHTRVEPVFLPHGLHHWPGTERLMQQLSHRFDGGRFDVRLREGDFLLLAPRHTDIDLLTPMEESLFLESGRLPQLYVYVVSCVKVAY